MKMAVSRLIIVRFKKFKIRHAQGSDADLTDVTMIARDDVMRARDVIDLVT